MMYKVEKDWTTNAGFRAVVVHTDKHRCGYVGVPDNHPLYNIPYMGISTEVKQPDEGEGIGKRSLLSLICTNPEALNLCAIFDVHGGLTYAGGASDYPVASDNLWWFGFDCGHYQDANSPEYHKEMQERYPNSPYMYPSSGVYRSLSYCEEECESLAQQFIDRLVREEV